MTEELFLIVNLLAGQGRCRRLWPVIERVLKCSGLPFYHEFTKAPGAATEVARRAAKNSPVVVAVGGDGTIHEVVGGLMGTGSRLGIIPAGTANDFVKMLGIPPDPHRAVVILKAGQTKRVDVGQLGERYFVNGLGLGLDGAVAWRVFWRRGWPGHFIYLYAAIREALSFRASELEVKGPDWSCSGRLMMVGATNGRHFGGFILTPYAEIDDGLFDVYMVSDMHPLRRITQIPKARRGAHLSLPEVRIERAPWVEITSERPLLGHLDGEPVELPPGSFRVELLPRALEVIAGS